MLQTVLITGGCGFIGTNLTRRLVQSGVRSVRVLDNLSRGTWSGLEDCDVTLVEQDVTEFHPLSEVFSGVDAVIHLAALGSVVESMEAPEENFRNNVIGTFNVLEAARRANVGKMIFASTGGALIGNAQPPVSETSLPRPISPYGASKLCGEAYLGAFGHAFDIETVCLRFANVYGPYSGHKRGVITAFMKAIKRGDPMVIYGDGSASRDFLYVDDLCRGIERALDATLAPGSVYHIASGVETGVAELAAKVARACGAPDHPVDWRPRRAGEVARNFARYDLARSVFGYEPEWSLDAGLKATWSWFSANGFGG